MANSAYDYWSNRTGGGTSSKTSASKRKPKRVKNNPFDGGGKAPF